MRAAGFVIPLVDDHVAAIAAAVLGERLAGRRVAPGAALDAGEVPVQGDEAGPGVALAAGRRLGTGNAARAIGAFGFDISLSAAAEAICWHSLFTAFLTISNSVFSSSRYYGYC